MSERGGQTEEVPHPSGARAARALARAARLAIRALGDVEPNPAVGCVIERDGQLLGAGHHRRFGSAHAEREALGDCRRRGHDPRGATVYCTLEPCCHHGKQPPCTDALIESGVARVVFARTDPGRASGGGAAVLRKAGIRAELSLASPLATHLSDPFVHRVRTGKPWVFAKWAQTLDGRIATRTGESQWITGPLMRRRVHRLRSRADAVLVGAGTVIADDPSLTARDVRRVRRLAARVVVESGARTSPRAGLYATAHETPTVLVTTGRRNDLPECVRQIVVPGSGDGVDIERAVLALGDELDACLVMVEAGPRILGSLIERDLIDEAFVHLAPSVLGDSEALAAAVGRDAPRLADAGRFRLVRAKPLADDIELHYRRFVEP